MMRVWKEIGVQALRRSKQTTGALHMRSFTVPGAATL